MINREHKRYGIYQKYDRKMSESDAMQLFVNFINLAKKLELNKGNRLMNFDKVQKGYDGEDFVQDLITLVAQCNIYKIPRIIKRCLPS